jgi:ATP-dependent Lon protease
MDRKMKVLIVDEQRRSRQSLRALFATWPKVSAIREAANGAGALRLPEDDPPDLVLIDGHIAEMGGLEIIQQVKARWPETGVVILSMYSDLENAAMAAGADAFVTKGEPPEVLLRILEAVARRGEQQERKGEV